MTKTLFGKVPVVGLLAILVAVLATPVSAGGSGISLKGQAGRFNTTTFQSLGNSTDAQASWTNRVALDGQFSMLLEKTTNDQFAFAAAVVDGVNGQTVGRSATWRSRSPALAMAGRLASTCFLT